MSQVQKVLCWIGQDRKPLVEVYTGERVMRYQLRDVHQLLDIADELHRVGNEGLIDAPRPEPHSATR
jgi:hypothetical protein